MCEDDSDDRYDISLSTQRLTFVLNNLMQGGTQAATLQLINSLATLGYSCDLVVVYPEETDFFEVPPSVNVSRVFPQGVLPRYALPFLRRQIVGLSQLSVRLRHFRGLRQAIGFCPGQIVVAMEAHTSALVCLAARGSSTPIVMSYRVHPSYARAPYWLRTLERRAARRHQTYVTAQAECIRLALEERLQPTNPITVIPNAVQERHVMQTRIGGKVRFTSHSRYEKQKGLDILLHAWKLACAHTDFGNEAQLTIHGGGSRDKYRQLVSDLAITESVALEGPISDVNDSLAQTDVYVSSSRYEGFPNALAEAMAAGIPCIATNCPGATEDLALNGRAVKLVPVDDATAMASQLVDLFRSKSQRLALGRAGADSVRRFTPEIVTSKWTQLFKEATQEA